MLSVLSEVGPGLGSPYRGKAPPAPSTGAERTLELLAKRGLRRKEGESALTYAELLAFVDDLGERLDLTPDDTIMYVMDEGALSAVAFLAVAASAKAAPISCAAPKPELLSAMLALRPRTCLTTAAHEVCSHARALRLVEVIEVTVTGPSGGLWNAVPQGSSKWYRFITLGGLCSATFGSWRDLGRLAAC